MLRDLIKRVPGARRLVRLARLFLSGLRASMRRLLSNLRALITPPHKTIDSPASLGFRWELVSLQLKNRFSQRPVVDLSTDAVVTMTTHGTRLARVHIAIESIARGKIRPARLMLWIDDPASIEPMPRQLQRLRRRGLEVVLCNNYGVHTKYYPYVSSTASLAIPLVTSDDDIVYPARWLSSLIAAHREAPFDTVCFQSTTMSLSDGHLTPYASWTPTSGRRASFAHFGTSVSGQLFPTALQEAARRRGEQFIELARTNDDLWLHAIAVESGIRTRLVDEAPILFPFVPGSQATGLYLVNYWQGENDRIIERAYGKVQLDAIASDLERVD